jgi:hypothetical protein
MVSFSKRLFGKLLLTFAIVCRDYGQVINYLESVRAYDDQQIY